MQPRMLILSVLTLLAGPLAAQSAVDVGGRQVTFRLRQGGAAPVKGELLAVSADSAWVLAEKRVVSVAMTMVKSASVSRHTMTASKGLLWGAGVGAVSGLALAAACGSIEGDECGGVVIGSTALGLAIGGLAAISLGPSSRWHFEPVTPSSLTRFARFPQGLPSGALQLLSDARAAP